MSVCVWGLDCFTIKLLLLPWSWWVVTPFLSFVLIALELDVGASHVLGLSLDAWPSLFLAFATF